MIRKKWLLIVLILLLAGAGVYFYQAKNKATPVAGERIPPQMVYRVTTGRIEKTITTEGYIAPVKEQDLTFPAKSSGSVKITGIYVKEGDRVEKGQLLMELDKTEAELRYTQRLNAYNRAKINGSQTEIAEAALDLKLAADELNNMKLTAPFAGIITNVYVEEGDYYTSGAVATIKDTSRLQIRVNIEEKNIPHLKPGLRAKVALTALPGVVVNGEVTEIADEAVISGSMVALPVTITLEKTNYEIKLNTSAKIDIIIGEVHDQVIIPVTAVFHREGQDMVMKIINGQAQPVPVKTGLSNGLQIAVESGLEPGDEILVNTYRQAGSFNESGQRPRGFATGPVMIRGGR